MPKLERFQMEIKTGDRRGPEMPRFSINGFPLDFDITEGGTESGETLKAVGSPGSFPHALTLAGPEEGQAPWDIESVRITYECMGQEPYSVRLGTITLDDESELNIWHERPAPVFDV